MVLGATTRPSKEISPSMFRYILISNIIALAGCGLIIAYTSSKRASYTAASRQASKQTSTIPDAIIFRRSKKSGSSSMLDQLLKITRSLGYEVVYSTTKRMQDIVHSAALQDPSRRFFLAEHNKVTRDDVPGRRVVIIETVMDGYLQMTSHCRYVKKVKECTGKEMDNCLRKLKRLNRFRWAGRSEEDAATYIDLPVSSLHPALSTTIMRRVFPDVILDVQHLNTAGSACREYAQTRKVYQEVFEELDKQVDILRGRMLVLAGYPWAWEKQKVTIREMMDKAEELERTRYERELGITFGKGQKADNAVSEDHRLMKDFRPHWERNTAGEVILDDRGHPDAIQ